MKETIILEIRAAEGGADAKLLCQTLLGIYARYAARHNLTLNVVEDLPGYLVVEVRGPAAGRLFAREAGGHRWQRVPPTERRGRVHTSTVTVAVLPAPSETEFRIDERDLEWSTCRAGGAGGQHVNKTESAVQLKHKPSGLMVRCESERSQGQNRVTALAVLRSRLAAAAARSAVANRNHERRNQIGSGQRGDKTRTVAAQRDTVTDHVTGKEMNFRRYERGFIEDLA